MAATDEWHAKLARELALGTPRTTLPEDAAALEIEFGRARSALTYALELARAHRVPATGCIGGDDVWIKLGDPRARFILNRREGYIAFLVWGQDEARARWDEAKGALLDPQGRPVDLAATARAAIDEMIAEWRKFPTRVKTPVPPVTSEDEPTRG